MKITLLKLLLPLLIMPILLVNCANPLPPPGGPQDTIPPVILEYFPQESTINFREESIILEFSKYMNKTEVTDNIFLSPQKEMEYDWSGKQLEIEFLEPLDSNTTYSLLIGTEYTDWKGNKPLESFTLTFSTGSKIDSGYFRGTLVDDKPSGAFIYAYRIDNINPDTLNPGTTKPQYRTQTGTTGNFKINALKEGTYRFFAIRDIDKDGVYSQGRDPVGAALSDAIVSGDSIQIVNLRLGKKIDKTKPQLYGADAAFDKRIIASFSESLDSSSIRKEAFEIMDSLETEKIEIKGVYPGSALGFVEIIIDTELDTNITYKLIAKVDEEICIRDSSKNMIDDTANVYYFYPIPDTDTLKPQLTNINLRDSLKKFFPTDPIRLIYNTAVEMPTRDAFKLTHEEKDIDFEIKQVTENIYDIVPKNKLDDKKWYVFEYNPTNIKDCLGRELIDTSFSYAFETGDISDYGDMSGVIKYLPAADNQYYIEAKSKDGKHKFNLPIGADGKFIFEKIPAGIYKFSVFLDNDGNGEYSFGDVFPFEYSEPFVIFNKSFELKARWSVEDIQLNWVE